MSVLTVMMMTIRSMLSFNFQALEFLSIRKENTADWIVPNKL